MTKYVLILFGVVGLMGVSRGQALVYRPNNPNFGGNTFNYAWMLSSATAQDKTKDPATLRNTSTSNRSDASSLDSYAQSLQNQLLNRITSNLVGRQFGETSLKPGTYTFGDFRVEIANGRDGMIVRIVDGKGGETSITVPYY